MRDYLTRRSTRFEPAGEITRERGYREFSSVEGELRRWVSDQAWSSRAGPRPLFDAAVGCLRERLVLLLGGSTLTRLVAAEREASTDVVLLFLYWPACFIRAPEDAVLAQHHL